MTVHSYILAFNNVSVSRGLEKRKISKGTHQLVNIYDLQYFYTEKFVHS
jgi:hypothetical protein